MSEQKHTKEELEQDLVDLSYGVINGIVTLAKIFFWVIVVSFIVVLVVFSSVA